MKFIETALMGAFIIAPDCIEDPRGFFARVFCEQEFAALGLETHFVQCSISFNHCKGTVRGMHYQVPPHEETKIVRCTKGKIYDVAVDLRRDSGTYKKWISVELSAENHQLFYVPKGFAHGFQTLEDDCEVCYQISVKHDSACSRGLHYEDKELAITWPLPVSSISDRDRTLPRLQSA